MKKGGGRCRQSRQSAKLFLSRPMGLPHTRLRERGSGVQIRTMGQTLRLSRYTCTLWNSQS
jgi:hypothetical protein